MILLDAKANPLRTVIGFSWFETPNLYLTQKRIIEGKGLQGLKLVNIPLFSIVQAAINKNNCTGNKESKAQCV